MVVPNAAVHGRRGVQGPAWPDRVVLQHWQQSQNHQGGSYIYIYVYIYIYMYVLYIYLYISCVVFFLHLFTFRRHQRHLRSRLRLKCEFHSSFSSVSFQILSLRYLSPFYSMQQSVKLRMSQMHAEKIRYFINKVAASLGCILMSPGINEFLISASSIKKV